ncbi:hypothetical protein CAPTEDRAFT_197268, partial [Capitella teleta]
EPCDEFLCALYCEYGNELDGNGCPICSCKPNPCEVTECAPGMKCEVVPSDCFGPLCAATAECKAIQCDEFLCALYCEYGNELDGNGCPICSCKPNPCEVTECAPGMKCEVVPSDCFGPLCAATAECKAIQCDEFLCAMYCEYGNELDGNGCPICSCKPNPCEVTECAPGTKCDVVPSDCFGPLCAATAECKAIQCDEFLCAMYCEYGNELDGNGCPICSCKPNPCEVTECAPGTKCDVVPSDCFGPLCAATAECKAIQCDEFLCAMYCEYGNELDGNGCPICSCKPNPCEVTECAPGMKCEVVPSDCFGPLCAATAECKAIQCDEFLCALYCEYGNELDGNGCPICSCKPNPCEMTIDKHSTSAVHQSKLGVLHKRII